MKIVETTNDPEHPYAPHLLIRGLSLAPGKEWFPQLSGLTLIQVENGNGYWLQGQSRVDLGPGTVLLAVGSDPGRILASCLNGMLLHFFTVIPERLIGLISQGELDFFDQAAGRKELAPQIISPHSPLARNMREICASREQGGLRFRLTLLQLITEVFGRELEQSVSGPLQTDVKERLRDFLLETPPAVLLEMEFEELARITHCSPRHLSRVFYDLVGMSFRDKRAEIRLTRARELLATSQAKVVEVAFKSGYKSLSLFNRMFTRRFGISPGRWRQKYGGMKNSPAKAKIPRMRLQVSQARI